MMIKKGISLFLIFSFFNALHPHGFGANTFVQNEAGGYWPIANIVDYVGEGHSLQVLSYDEFEESFIPKKVKSAGFCESEYCCRLSFNHSIISLECTPLQLFYRVKDNSWVAAFKLQAGDKLLCADNKMIEVSTVELVHEKLKVYTLEVKGTHTFLVTRHNIVVHNMLIPICGAIGFTLPFDIGCGAAAGSMFGPFGICGGIVVGGAVGCIINACVKNRVAEYDVSFKPQDVKIFADDHRLHNFAKTVEDILKGTILGSETKGRAKQYIKNGGYSVAVKDFEDLEPTNVKEIKNREGKKGKVGALSDGRKINVRDWSEDGRPTIEIQKPNGNGKVIKIRYEDSKN